MDTIRFNVEPEVPPPVMESPELDGSQNALNKMARAAKRGTGCHLTADEIRSLSLTSIGELWEQDDPRTTGDSA